jgi:predicted AAA+ superfamily ATPase
MASGIAEYMLGRNIDSRQYEETHIMENIIYNELLIKGYNVDVGMVSIIIVKDGPTHYNESGILILNLFDFLLKENSLEY